MLRGRQDFRSWVRRTSRMEQFFLAAILTGMENRTCCPYFTLKTLEKVWHKRRFVSRCQTGINQVSYLSFT